MRAENWQACSLYFRNFAEMEKLRETFTLPPMPPIPLFPLFHRSESEQQNPISKKKQADWLNRRETKSSICKEGIEKILC